MHAASGPSSGQAITTRQRPARQRPTLQWGVAGLLAIHAGLLAYSASKHSPVWEEYWHLVAGVSHWETGRFDLFRVNPPLVRTTGTIPVMFAGCEMDWSDYIAPYGKRPEWLLREDFFRLNGARTLWLVVLARWACIPFSLIGGLACYLFATRLYDVPTQSPLPLDGAGGGGEEPPKNAAHRRFPVCGLTALTIWCFSPTILGNAQLIMPDAAAAAMGLAAHYAFWRYLASPSLKRAAGSGVLLGLAMLCKSTWIVLPPIWVAFWLVWRWKRGREQYCSARELRHVNEVDCVI